ncbi:MAG: argininosuccinate lyase, partial [Candidatus Aureabacteria bacterium]|nr:argininosuccinate lyase [Candidatus Auribacterota bacterium]
AGLIGNVVAMLTVMKGLPMTYNRDMQEDKKLLFDSVDTVTQMLEITAEFVNGITLNKKVINNLVNKDLGLFATDIAEYLVKKGLPFRDAHHVVGEIMASNIAKKKPEEVNLKALKVFSSKFSSDVIKILNAENSVKLKKSSGSPAPSKVKEELKKWI